MSNDNPFIRDCVSGVKPSGIRRFFSIVEEMEDCVSLGIGEPDFVTPWHIRDAGIRSLEEGHTHYTGNSGMPQLRRGIAAYMERRFGLSYDPQNEILVTVGGSEAIDLCIRATIDKGDEVIIPQPSFVCYAPITTFSGGTPVILPTYEKNKFKIDPEDLRKAITPKTKLLVLPYPNNPTGAIMTKDELQKIVDILKDKDILVLSDELYAELTFGDNKHCSIASFPEMRDKTVVINGFSKSFAMTGWRLGFALGNADIIKQMTKIHQFAIMSAPTTSQYAAIEAINESDEDIEYMKEQYDMRRRFILDGLLKLGLSCFTPEGAFYIFPSIKKFGMSSEEFCQRLVKEERLAVIPGDSFGESGEGYIRISYAYSISEIKEALSRLQKFIERL